MGNSNSSPRRNQRQSGIPNPGPVPVPTPPAPVAAPPPPGYPGLHPQYRPPPSAGYLPYPPQYPGAPGQWGGYAPNGQYYAMQGNGQWMMNSAAPPMFRMPVPPVSGPPPQMVEPQRTATIRNDVNLKRSTLRLEQDPENPGQHLVAFSFDATVAGSVCIFFLAKEGESCSFTSLKPELYTPVKVPFEKGLGQRFRQAVGTGVDLSRFSEEELTKEGPGEAFPLVVRTEAVPKNPPPGVDGRDKEPAGAKLPKWVQSQTTYAVLERHLDGGYSVKVSKQKIWVDGMRYELQEIYGIEHSGGGGTAESSSDIGKECVICMSEPRDTTVLPCRHMCMCSECAKVLRFQDNRCPICRQVVERLLEIRVPAPTRPGGEREGEGEGEGGGVGGRAEGEGGAERLTGEGTSQESEGERGRAQAGAGGGASS